MGRAIEEPDAFGQSPLLLSWQGTGRRPAKSKKPVRIRFPTGPFFAILPLSPAMAR